MESVGHVVVPLRTGGKKMKKRRELDALVAHSLAKRACNASGNKRQAGNGINSQDQLLSQSTDDQEQDYSWPKVRVPSRCRTKRYSFLKTCGPLVFLLTLLLLFGFMYWLYFDLRQQITEHRIKIERVLAISQNVPDALQTCHETSKILEKNQSNINEKILLLKQKVDSFEILLGRLNDDIIRKKEDSENSQVSVLVTNVADFGAKIKALTIDMEEFKTHYRQMEETETEMKSNYENLKILVNQTTGNGSLSSAGTDLNKTNEIVKNITEHFTNEIKNLSTQLNTANYTLYQKNNGLDDDIKQHKNKLEELTESSAKMNSHLISVENDLVEYKKKTIDLEQQSSRNTNELIFMKNKTSILAESMNLLTEEMKQNGNRVKSIDVNQMINTPEPVKTLTFEDVIRNGENITVNETAAPSNNTLPEVTTVPAAPIVQSINHLYLNSSVNNTILIICQNAPDALQTCNETFKILDTNQSNINKIILLLQQKVDSFEMLLRRLNDDIIRKNEDSLGKEDYRQMQETEMKSIYEDLKILVNQTTGNDSLSSAGTDLNKTNEIVKNITDDFTNEINNLSTQLNTANYTLYQKNNGLDDDIKQHKNKLEELTEWSAKLNSHFISVENDLIDYNKKTIDLEQQPSSNTNELIDMINKTSILAESMNILTEEMKQNGNSVVKSIDVNQMINTPEPAKALTFEDDIRNGEEITVNETVAPSNNTLPELKIPEPTIAQTVNHVYFNSTVNDTSKIDNSK